MKTLSYVKNFCSIYSPYCFIAGTVVLTVTGKRVIESIEAGDLVWAWDETTGDVALKEVIETYENETTELVHVFVNGDEIISTPAHPFYLPDEGWTTAEYLDPGDTVVLANGDFDVIDEVYHETLAEPVTVYNFNVEDYHTYYVGEDSVLVHNSCSHNNKWNVERRRYWRHQSKTLTSNHDYGSFVATPENIKRMKRGVAPIGWDGMSVQLHHTKGIANDFYDYIPVSKTLHDAIHIFS